MIKVLTTKEVAKRFRVTTETIRRWIRTGKLKAKKINGYYLVLEEDIADLFVDIQADKYNINAEQFKVFIKR